MHLTFTLFLVAILSFCQYFSKWYFNLARPVCYRLDSRELCDSKNKQWSLERHYLTEYRETASMFLAKQSLHSPWSFRFFLTKIYRRVKIGLWIWCITTKLWLRYFCPVPMVLSGEFNLASGHQPLLLHPTIFCPTVILWFWRTELISLNFWNAACWEMVLQKGCKRQSLEMMRCLPVPQYFMIPW